MPQRCANILGLTPEVSPIPGKATTNVVCAVCQKEFTAFVVDARRGKAKSCSIVCRHASLRKPKVAVEIGPSSKKHAPWPERFWRKVQKTDDCWNWLAYRDPAGYGKFSRVGSHSEYAHRIAYEVMVGPIGDGLELDHLCHNADPSCNGVVCPHRGCVNPLHLEAVPHRINALRGNGWAGRSARGELTEAMQTREARHFHADSCKRGHSRNPENTHVDARGQWKCRVCERARRRYGQKRAVSSQ